ncbi:uncharacterized protein [Henckelia pumila]|uniref:uncharacterized protein n=1 Tax=Henckelia pumila TaxID=405737 RepID=UPI003C6DB865
MGGSESSSGEEDGDAEWKAAIDSVAAVSCAVLETYEDEERGIRKSQKVKHYQIKARKLLDEILDKTLEVVPYTTPSTLDETSTPTDVGVRLFKRAPPGIVFDHIDELHGPSKKPKILPGEELDEKSKKFKKRLQSVVVDGADIAIASRVACQKSLAKLEAREAAAKAAAKREEDRVAELKRIRGERWLPSVARDMRVGPQNGR